MLQSKEELKTLARLLEAKVGGADSRRGGIFLSGKSTKTRLASE